MSLKHNVDLAEILEHLHERLANIEKRLGIQVDDQYFPPPSPEDKEAYIKDAFEYVYTRMFVDYGTQQARVNDWLRGPPYDQLLWHLYRSPIADGLKDNYIKSDLGRSISVNRWLEGFKQLSTDRDRRDYSASASLIARDCVVRALLSAGRLPKQDRAAISEDMDCI
jgi:hypothetical protein